MNNKISVDDKQVFAHKLVSSTALFCIASLFSVQSHAVDFAGTMSGTGPGKDHHFGVINASQNKIRACAFDGGDKFKLIAASSEKLGKGEFVKMSCSPGNSGKCRVRFVPPKTGCDDKTWPVYSIAVGMTIVLDGWNGFSDSSFKISRQDGVGRIQDSTPTADESSRAYEIMNPKTIYMK